MSDAVGADRRYLAYQYADADKLRVRIRTHELYSERPTKFGEWLLPHLEIAPGQLLLDVGCGPGTYHPLLPGVRVAACDASPGMIRAAVRQALESDLDVRGVVGDAERLPFRSATFDRVMANHMLYHVPDQHAGLAEMRRVLRPGGRAVLATNGADHLEELWRMHRLAAGRAGFVASEELVDRRFTLAHVDLVRSVFKSARVYEHIDALVFKEPAPLLEYYGTFMVDHVAERPTDDSHRPRVMQAMHDVVAEEMGRNGVLRIPKRVGCFVADV